jgi:branched-chain amino acid transport system ATP-binding protein
MDDAVLRLRDVTMRFGGVVALDSLSLEVRQGEIVALIGPNGAGKTTAFNCVTGVYEPTSGGIELHGQSVLRRTPDWITARGIARTFQNIRLFKALSVYENVLIAKHMRAKQNVFTAAFRLNAKEERRMREEALRLLEEQNLAQFKDHVASSLPYGLQRRLEIARALATGPSLLLLDEPAAGMNPQETQELAAFIKQIRDDYRLTVFIIEHHMDLVMRISDRIYVLDFGKRIADGTPAQVRGDKRVIDAYLGVADDAEH